MKPEILQAFQRLELNLCGKETIEQRTARASEFERNFDDHDADVLNRAIDEWLDKERFFPRAKQLEDICVRLLVEGKFEPDNQFYFFREEKGNTAWQMTFDKAKADACESRLKAEDEAIAREHNLPYPCITREHQAQWSAWVKKRYGGMYAFTKPVPGE